MSLGTFRFETPLGPATLGWRDRVLTHLHLGDDRVAGDAEPPDWVLAIAQRVATHLAGRHDTFDDVALDLGACPAFHARVYRALRDVGPGQTVTYGELAVRVGSPRGARAVGQAVGANPWLLIVPCHRVLAAGGRLGGFSAPGGVATKQRLLALEGVG
jgi:methylated-DNA-[protein]-cysteine S-methyltransferase